LGIENEKLATTTENEKMKQAELEKKTQRLEKENAKLIKTTEDILKYLEELNDKFLVLMKTLNKLEERNVELVEENKILSAEKEGVGKVEKFTQTENLSKDIQVHETAQSLVKNSHKMFVVTIFAGCGICLFLAAKK